VKVFGSVGMVTEFARFYDRFPDSYQQALCQDVQGRPVKVPWLTDHQHHGIPFWWCCTQQPLFCQYLRERVIDTVQAGADGVHIDDHMGTAGGLWLGVCFCDRCLEGFRQHLQAMPAPEQSRLGLTNVATFNYRDVVSRWIAEDPRKERKPTQHALWPTWTAYQCRAAAAFMLELRELAAKTAGHPVPIGANAGLLWPRHLADYQALDLFSAETSHHASGRQCTDLPIFAYRMADAVHRPYAATAAGDDWAYIKEHNLPGLVRGWIALGYAAGHFLMAPHRQWCYTPEKGTHWYEGPAEKFAPLYQFVRENTSLFDGYETFADVAVVLPHRSFVANPNRWFEVCQQLAGTNVSYRLLLGGDDIVNHPLELRESESAVLLALSPEELLPADRQQLDHYTQTHHVFRTAADALAAVRPAVDVSSSGRVRALPRVKPGSAVIHLLNLGYDSTRDDITPLDHVRVTFNRPALGLSADVTASWAQPQSKTILLEINGDSVTVPNLGLWGVLSLAPRR
jgi:hypothetical protein